MTATALKTEVDMSGAATASNVAVAYCVQPACRCGRVSIVHFDANERPISRSAFSAQTARALAAELIAAAEYQEASASLKERG
jgi:uncharacterized protein (DUF362 family)